MVGISAPTPPHHQTAFPTLEFQERHQRHQRHQRPSAPISITAKGKKINLFYDGCLTTPTGGEDPTVEECIKDSRQNFDNDGNNVTYSGVVRLPVDGGKSATHMYISSSGLTVKQIRAFVRSLQTVS